MKKIFYLLISFLLIPGAGFSFIDKQEIPLQEEAYVITMSVEEKAELRFSQLQRFLITNPAIAYQVMQKENTLIIEAKKIGSTFLHVWDSQGRKTIKFVIKRKELPESTVAKREEERLRKKDTFKIAYQYEFVTTDIGPEFNKTSNDFIRHQHLATITGNTPYGYVWGYVRFQDYDNTSFADSYSEGGLRILNFSKMTHLTPDPSWGPYNRTIMPHNPIGPFKDFTLIGGDQYYNITPLTAPWSLARGAFWYHTIFNEAINYSLLWAQDKEPFKFVGAGAPEFNSPDHYYTGGDITWHAADFLDLGFTFLASYGDRKESVADHVVAGNYFADFENLTFNGEFAQTEDAIAWRSGSDLYLGEIAHLGGIYRNIKPDFFAINGQTADRGEKGFMFQGEVDPLDYLHLSASVDHYRDRLFPNEEDPNRYNTDFLLRGRMDLPWRTYLTSTYRDADRLGSLMKRKESSYSFQLNKTFTKPRGLGFFARYEKKTVDNYRTSLLSYDRDAFKIGGRWQIFPGLSFGVTQEWARVESGEPPLTLTVPNFDFPKTEIFSPIDSYLINERTHPRRFTADINYNTRIAQTPFYLDLRFRYEDEENTESINSFFAGEDTLQGEAEIAYIPSDSFKAYCRGRLEDRKSEIDGERDLVEAELVVGANVIFDTGISWEPKGEVQGVVFKDLNGNGTLEEGEPGISGILLTADEGKKATTDENGSFNFGLVQGRVLKVTLDLETIPSGFISTTPFSQEVSILERKKSNVNFGIFARSGLRGIVYQDVNENGFLDGEDKGVANVVIRLSDGKEVVTDKEGRYYFETVSPGEYELKLVLDSLPLNYLPKASIKQKLVVAEGRIHNRDFPIQVSREIKGKVFGDSNRNGQWDTDERGIEKQMVSIGPNLILTDTEGNFSFKNISIGKHVVELSQKSIPEGFALSSPSTYVVNFDSEATLADQINFGLKSKDGVSQ